MNQIDSAIFQTKMFLSIEHPEYAEDVDDWLENDETILTAKLEIASGIGGLGLPPDIRARFIAMVREQFNRALRRAAQKGCEI